jgi:hypothetical protein
LILTALGGCSRCQEKGSAPIPVDPCALIKPVSAKFRVHESQGPLYGDTLYNNYYDSDTLMSPSLIFTATDSTAATYKWYIGRNTFDTKSISLSNFPYGQPITIKLVTTKAQTKNNCLLTTQLKDSLTRTIYISHPWVDNRRVTKVYGRFRGILNNNPNDTITLSFVGDSINDFFPYGYVYTYNFIRDSSLNYLDDYLFVAYRTATFGSRDNQTKSPNDTVGYALWGRIDCTVNGNVRIHFVTRKKTFSLNPFVLHSVTTQSNFFNGRRI